MKSNKIKIFTFLFCSILFGNTSMAQKDVDSLLDYASKLVYENPGKAIEVALEIYNRDGVSSDFKVESLLTISRGYTSQRQYQKSLEYALLAEKNASQIDEKQKINVLNYIGNQYQQLNIYDKAIEYLDASLAITTTLPKTDSIASVLGYNYATRGFIYREQMNCDIALTYFDKAIKEFSNQKSTASLNGNISIMLYNKGNCLISQNKNKEAKNTFLKSIDYAKKNDAKSLIAFAQKGLASVMTLEGSHREAIDILKKAEENSNNVGDLILNQGMYSALSNNYLALNDLSNYKVFQTKYELIQEKIKKNERKTINQSIAALITQNKKSTNQLNGLFNKIIWALYFLIIGVVILLISTTLIKEKKLKKLEKSLKL